MYLKKMTVDGKVITYHCKSKSQAKRWLRSQGLTRRIPSVIKDSFAFVTPGDFDNYARLFWQDYLSQKPCWVLHHLSPGV